MGGSGGRFKEWAPFGIVVKGDFRLLWIGEAISQVGDSLNRVALLWFVYQTTWRRSPRECRYSDGPRST
jgi:hypothetical protein